MFSVEESETPVSLLIRSSMNVTAGLYLVSSSFQDSHRRRCCSANKSAYCSFDNPTPVIFENRRRHLSKTLESESPSVGELDAFIGCVKLEVLGEGWEEEDMQFTLQWDYKFCSVAIFGSN